VQCTQTFGRSLLTWRTAVRFTCICFVMKSGRKQRQCTLVWKRSRYRIKEHERLPYLYNTLTLFFHLLSSSLSSSFFFLLSSSRNEQLARTTIMLDMNDEKYVPLREEIKLKKGLANVDGAVNLHKPLDHYIRTHYWYAFVADCSLEMYNHQVPPIYYNITFKNSNGEHLPGRFFLICCNRASYTCTYILYT
jgi:hypothetical protein